MNYLLAKVKRKQNLFRVLSTEDEIYHLPDDLNNSVDYDPSTLLEEEEWYKIESFSATDYVIDFLMNDFDSVNHSQIGGEDTSKISYLCSVEGDYDFFQIINSNLLIRKKWFSLDELSIEINKPIITLNNVADAIYSRVNDVLYFKKLSAANSIFKGMDQLYRQATDVETQNFLASDFLAMQNGFDANSVKIPNRKRIAMVMDTLNNYNVQEKADIYAYIQDYCNVPFNNEKFEIQTEDDLKSVLFGIEQRYYTTRLGNERRIANSIITIP